MQHNDFTFNIPGHLRRHHHRPLQRRRRRIPPPSSAPSPAVPARPAQLRPAEPGPGDGEVQLHEGVALPGLCRPAAQVLRRGRLQHQRGGGVQVRRDPGLVDSRTRMLSFKSHYFHFFGDEAARFNLEFGSIEHLRFTLWFFKRLRYHLSDVL